MTFPSNLTFVHKQNSCKKQGKKYHCEIGVHCIRFHSLDIAFEKMKKETAFQCTWVNLLI